MPGKTHQNDSLATVHNGNDTTRKRHETIDELKLKKGLPRNVVQVPEKANQFENDEIENYQRRLLARYKKLKTEEKSVDSYIDYVKENFEVLRRMMSKNQKMLDKEYQEGSVEILRSLGRSGATISESKDTFLCHNEPCPRKYKPMSRDKLSTLPIGLSGACNLLFGATFPEFDPCPTTEKKKLFPRNISQCHFAQRSLVGSPVGEDLTR
ncbi:hypothetical protein [Parasitella parasitica]|uniref:Uncharacterized protein n=1 Tax=Parasitella parasitica TaxID=35722 RepID=A0A0B7NHV7_9FUNG|nr:hypothetical protein [Parasitella parasitica]